MKSSTPTTRKVTVAQLHENFMVFWREAQSGKRYIVTYHKSKQPVAAVVSIRDLDLLQFLDKHFQVKKRK